MKDYKLSELKDICEKYSREWDRNSACENFNCPIHNECMEIANLYFADLQLEEVNNYEE